MTREGKKAAKFLAFHWGDSIESMLSDFGSAYPGTENWESNREGRLQLKEYLRDHGHVSHPLHEIVEESYQQVHRIKEFLGI